MRATGHDVGDSCELWSDGKWTDVKGKSFRNPGFDQTGDHPAVCISWEDAQAYVRWLGVKTGKTYRLPSEAEWEYAARAGSVTDYWWGPVIDAGQANYGKRTTSLGRPAPGNPVPGEPLMGTMAASSFRPNPWGLHNVHGNAWEWVQDCWNNDYIGAPGDGSVWVSGHCGTRVLRGGAFVHDAIVLRVTYRTRRNAASRGNLTGFRVARSSLDADQGRGGGFSWCGGVSGWRCARLGGSQYGRDEFVSGGSSVLRQYCEVGRSGTSRTASVSRALGRKS